MSSAFLFVTLFAQSIWPDLNPRQPRATAMMQELLDFEHQPDSAQSQKRAMAYQQYRFATSFNHLTQKLNEFIHSYNQGTLDLKKIEEVKKAWRDLERTEARFRLEKGK